MLLSPCVSGNLLAHNRFASSTVFGIWIVFVSGKTKSVQPAPTSAPPIISIGHQGPTTSLRIISCGARRLPTRAENPQIPIAVPRTIVGNSSTAYKFMPQNRDTASPLAKRAQATRRVSVGESVLDFISLGQGRGRSFNGFGEAIFNHLYLRLLSSDSRIECS